MVGGCYHRHVISPATRAAVAGGMASAAAAKVAARSSQIHTRQQMALTAQQAALAPKAAAGTSAKKPAKAAAKKAAAPTSPLAAPGAEVSPYLDSTALLAMGDRAQTQEAKHADMGADYAAQAAAAIRGTQEAELDRVSGGETIKNSAAARGLERSSIRDGGLDTNDAEAARKVSGLQSDLAVKAVQNDETRARDLRGDKDFMSALYARAAENAASVTRDPRGAPVTAPSPPSAGKPSAARPAPAKKTASGGFTSPARAAQQAIAQRRAGNVKGSPTLRRSV